jgi:Uri superfamily endonuclease
MSQDWSHTADTLPKLPGAYALLITLARPAAGFAPGRYAYLGSARGPGGIRARCARHLRQDKVLRWHVDRLTVTADVAALAIMNGDECNLTERLLAHGAHAPVPGFGSSDCRNCPAHLVALPETLDEAKLAALLRE